MKREKEDKGIARRSFLKWGGASLLSLPFLTQAKLAFGTAVNCWKVNYWEGPEDGKYCVNRTVYDGEVNAGYIWARIDGWWRRFEIREVEDVFWEWSFSERIQSLEARIAGTHTPTAGGPHTPAVATYGNGIGRGDSSFHINNKFVGADLVPKKENIKEINDTITSMLESGVEYVDGLKYLKEIHEQDIWRRGMHVGIEYFTNPEFETHTFLNMMENPVATLCFQGSYDIFKSFEIRCVPQIVHLANPSITEDSDIYQIAKFPFMIMSLFHGDPVTTYNQMPAVIYHHIEEYNNSMSEHGIRVVRTLERNPQRLYA